MKKRPFKKSPLANLAIAILILSAAFSTAPAADPPGILSHQGRIAVNGVNHDGPGFFKFSLVKDVGVGTEAILWHHDGTGAGQPAPAGEVDVTVSKGHYSVLLGQAPMTEIPASVFTDNDHVSLRVWFSTTSGSGFEHLAPDRRVASVGYALAARTIMGSGINLSGGNLTLPPTTATSGILYSGTNTMLHSYGLNNFFAGEGAGNLTTTAFGLTGVGKGALKNNTTGHRNTALGRWAMRENTTGVLNNAIGHEALRDNTEGSENTATGRAAMFRNTTGNRNTATGQIALRDNTIGNDNTAIGRQAMMLNTTGSANTAVGKDALRDNTTGMENAAVGSDSLQLNTTGSHNTAMGEMSLGRNTTGERNTGIGNFALGVNTLGSYNTALGMNTLFTNTTGEQNTGLGQSSLARNTTGSYNTGAGEDALLENTTGHRNTAVGNNALWQNTTGDDNIALGDQAGSNLTIGDDNITIGNVGVADESSTIRIGDSDQNRAFLAGVRGITTGVNDAVAVMVDSNGQLGTFSSSRRYKEDIHDLAESNTSARLRALRPVTFRYKQRFDDGEQPIQFGLIAEEVAAVFPELAVFNEAGQPETVKYHLLAPLLLEEVQKLQRANETLRTEKDNHFKAIEAENKALRRRLEKLEAAVLGREPSE